MRRVPEVIDVWFDSGSMPFAQYHAPHEGTELFEERFPADFICEALDQTRGWFYSLIAVSTLLFDRSPYRNVVCLGLILDEEGRKMSKSLGNTVEPWEVIDRFGADALRWYFFTSKQPWDGYRFSLETIGEAVRQFLLQLWNTYGFYVLYANANGIAREPQPSAERDRARPVGAVASAGDDRDRPRAAWTTSTPPPPAARSRRSSTSSRTGTCAGRAGASGTATRPRSRRCATCLLTTAKLLAPFCPFVADEIYDNLDGAEPSVHLCDFPDAGERDLELETRWRSRARPSGSASPPAARPSSRCASRCARRSSSRPGPSARRSSACREIVREELNVQELRFVSEADELGEIEIKPNYRTLGPRFGKQMPLVAAAVAGLDAGARRRALRDGEPVAIIGRRPRPRARRRRPARRR